MIHDAIYSLYSKAKTINGDTKETIVVKDTNGNEVSVNWTEVEAKAKELETAFVAAENNKIAKKASAITKLKGLGLDDDEINALMFS